MEIKGPGRIETGAIRRKTTSTAGSFTVSDAHETQGGIVSGPGPIAALDSILLLQGMDDSTDGRAKGQAHGEQLLNLLVVLMHLS